MGHVKGYRDNPSNSDAYHDSDGGDGAEEHSLECGLPAYVRFIGTAVPNTCDLCYPPFSYPN